MTIRWFLCIACQSSLSAVSGSEAMTAVFGCLWAGAMRYSPSQNTQEQSERMFRISSTLNEMVVLVTQ